MGASALAVGDERVVQAGPVAHGGHVVSHSDGHTLFVRHALPGETVRIVVTEVSRRIVRADAVEVVIASVDRVDAPCAWSRPGACGGCDFQHASLPAQRAMKTTVLREALTRFGKVGEASLSDLVVEELPGSPDGLGWRTRMRWGVTSDGVLGLRAHRRHQIVRVDSCLLAAGGLNVEDIGQPTTQADEVIAARGSDGTVACGSARVRQEVGGRVWRVAADSFWQVHPALAGALQESVLDQGRPSEGEAWWDLYCGAGLLAAALAERVGGAGSVEAVELSSDSIREARRALHDLPQVRLHGDDVVHWLRGRAAGPAPHGVVMDPPRAGACAGTSRSLTTTRSASAGCDHPTNAHLPSA